VEATRPVPPPRSSSKRSRAAEFHNLSEKVLLFFNFMRNFSFFFVVIDDFDVCREEGVGLTRK